MKKSILIIALMASAALSFGQNNTATSRVDTTSSKPYAADPKRIYQVELTSEQIGSLLQASQAGVIPYLKSIKLPMDKLDNAQAYFNAIAASISYQYRLQYVADSLKSVKSPNVKK